VRDLVLDRGVALQLWDRDQAQERQQQLVERGYRAVREHHGPRRVQSDGQVVEHQAGDVLIQVLGVVPVGQHLVVRDQHEYLGAEVLQPDAVAQGAEVVSQVQLAGRPVPGQDPEPGGVPVDQLLDLSRTPPREPRTHGHRPPLGPAGQAGSGEREKAAHPDGLEHG
jgi:hypothetical protein